MDFSCALNRQPIAGAFEARSREQGAGLPAAGPRLLFPVKQCIPIWRSAGFDSAATPPGKRGRPGRTIIRAPDGSASYFLSRIVGMRRAKEMALLNPVLTARQALEWGLVNRVTADEELLPVALDMARRFAAGPTRSYGTTKRLILSGATESLESQMEREARAISEMASAVDGREGMNAFINKRTPVFRGE